MKPLIKDERTGLTYELVGDHYLPAGEDDLPPLGIWGRRRLSYLKTHRRDLYADLLLSRKLEEHLSSIDADAAEMANRLTAQLARTEGVTEALKIVDPMAWIILSSSSIVYTLLTVSSSAASKPVHCSRRIMQAAGLATDRYETPDLSPF